MIKKEHMTYFKGQTSPHSANYRAETWVEHPLQNVGNSALHGSSSRGSLIGGWSELKTLSLDWHCLHC